MEAGFDRAALEASGFTVEEEKQDEDDVNTETGGEEESFGSNDSDSESDLEQGDEHTKVFFIPFIVCAFFDSFFIRSRFG